MWETELEFLNFLQQSWASLEPSNSMQALVGKLNAMSCELLGWNGDILRHVKKEIQKMQTKLECLRAILDRVGPSAQENAIVDKLTEWYHREEIM